MTRYTVKTATAKFSEYGEVEFSKTSSGYAVSFRSSLTQVVTEAKTLTSLVEQLTFYLTEKAPQGQATELTCEYVPPAKPSLKERLEAQRKVWKAQEEQENARRMADALYTDDQFRRNGYGHYDCCPLPVASDSESSVYGNDQYYMVGGDLYHINGWYIGSYSQCRCQHLFSPFTSSARNSYVSKEVAIKQAIAWFECYYLKEYQLSCPLPEVNDTEEDEERGTGRVDEKLNNDSQAHQAVNNVVSLSMWKNSSKPVSEVGSKSAKALEKRLAKLGIKPSRLPVAA